MQYNYEKSEKKYPGKTIKKKTQNKIGTSCSEKQGKSIKSMSEMETE